MIDCNQYQLYYPFEVHLQQNNFCKKLILLVHAKHIDLCSSSSLLFFLAR